LQWRHQRDNVAIVKPVRQFDEFDADGDECRASFKSEPVNEIAGRSIRRQLNWYFSLPGALPENAKELNRDFHTRPA